MHTDNVPMEYPGASEHHQQQDSSGALEVSKSRAAQEVQAMVIMAKRFPARVFDVGIAEQHAPP